MHALPPDVGVIGVCPSHQFPLGITMSKRRRAQLIDFARQHGAVIIEDDYDGEFRYDSSPLQSLRVLRPKGHRRTCRKHAQLIGHMYPIYERNAQKCPFV